MEKSFEQIVDELLREEIDECYDMEELLGSEIEQLKSINHSKGGELAKVREELQKEIRDWEGMNHLVKFVNEGDKCVCILTPTVNSTLKPIYADVYLRKSNKEVAKLVSILKAGYEKEYVAQLEYRELGFIVDEYL